MLKSLPIATIPCGLHSPCSEPCGLSSLCSTWEYLSTASGAGISTRRECGGARCWSGERSIFPYFQARQDTMDAISTAIHANRARANLKS